jgi:16S rRNA (guanine527-N7)-methyltransferase
VEHDILKTLVSDHHISIDAEQERKLLQYAHLLHETNKKFNLTGIANIDEILRNLIVGSIEPVKNLNVPRGTLFADIGSGAGIPGIPIGIFHPAMLGILVESNHKKTMFISSMIRDLELTNLSVYHGRIEEYQAEGRREQFEIVLSRALGDPYYVIELGAPLTKMNGLLYIYSNINPDELPEHVREHSDNLGLSIATTDIRNERGIADNGLLFIKTGKTENRFPRKVSIIKRDLLRNSRSSIT